MDLRSAVPLANLIDTELAREGIRLNEIDSIAAIVPCVKIRARGCTAP